MLSNGNAKTRSKQEIVRGPYYAKSFREPHNASTTSNGVKKFLIIFSDDTTMFHHGVISGISDQMLYM